MLIFRRPQPRPQGANVARPVQAAAHPALGNIAIEIFRCPLHPYAGPMRVVVCTRTPQLDNARPQEWACGQCGRRYPLVDRIMDLLAWGEAPDVLREHEISQWDEQAAQYEPTRRDDALYQATV